jgi:hypothetical protein
MVDNIGNRIDRTQDAVQCAARVVLPELIQRTPELALADERVQSRYQFGRMDRFHQVIPRAAFKALDSCDEIRKTRHHDDLGVRISPGDPIQGFDAVYAGHPDIEQDDIECRFLHSVETLFAARCGLHGITGRLKSRLHGHPL